MSHTVTVRTATVTTRSGSGGVLINVGYIKTYRGILKILEVLLGIVCVGIMGNHIDSYRYFEVADIFFLLMVTTFLIATFLLLLSCLVSITTDSLISKTIHEVIYHAVGFALLLAASLNLLVKVTDSRHRSSREYELLLGAAICGLINCAFYFCSTMFGLRLYRRF
ncbi:hypothetical protein PV325_007710 [Microctonus aethiopoides]|uniref:MARVEL domain-containing protein n=1 Tax=Microctonus aethiopoides TaxID=144406 RepID=A0AA39FKN6_9HYME|nr:hypothetical protein PV325_007710 [Microctonus aethiopoides]KAK0171064.1 hypothetical protein PV328_008828 [Microctonus aethiopoides]